jgi:hypothetical protein
MLDVRIKMRLGGCVACSQNSDTDTGVGRSYDPRSTTRGQACRTSVCVQADLDRCAMCKVLWVVEIPFLGYTGVSSAFEELWNILVQGQQRKWGS